MNNNNKHFPVNARKKWELLLLLLAGGLCIGFSQGRWPVPLATFLAYILMMRFFRLSTPWMGITGFLFIHTIAWDLAYTGLIPIPFPWRLIISVSFSICIGLIFLADRWVARHNNKFYTTFVFPSGLVFFEYLVGNFSPGGSGSSIANSFTGSLAFAQLASVTGWTGITFIVGWVASVVNRFWESNAKGPKRYPGLMYCGATIALILIFGHARLWKSYGGDSVRAGLVVGESTLPEEGELRSDVLKYLKGEPLTDGKFISARAHVRKVIDRNFQLAENALQAGAKFVVFPEANPAITPFEEKFSIEKAQHLATKYDAFVGLGFYIFQPQEDIQNENKFTFILSDGNLGWEYFKAKLVPGSNHKVGDGILPVHQSDFGKLSAAICFDMDFPVLMHQAGKQQIDILFGPSNDWPAISEIHVRMARMRVIEQGYSLVRPTGGGFSLVTDPRGRTTAFQNTSLPGEHVLLADVFTKGVTTVYSIIGDTFSWLCIAGFVLILMATLIQFRN